MFNSDDKDVIAAFNELGLTYRWEQLNIDLNPELHKRQFQLITHFYYKKGQAEVLPEVIKYHILKDFEVLLKLIQLKKLNVDDYYIKIYTENNNPILTNYIEDLSTDILLHEINWVLEHTINNYDKFLSTDEYPRYIIEIRFIFTLIEDFFDV